MLISGDVDTKPAGQRLNLCMTLISTHGQEPLPCVHIEIYDLSQAYAHIRCGTRISYGDCVSVGTNHGVA